MLIGFKGAPLLLFFSLPFFPYLLTRKARERRGSTVEREVISTTNGRKMMDIRVFDAFKREKRANERQNCGLNIIFD